MGDWASEGRDPTREEVDRLPGLAVVEFGATWCGYCQAIRPQMEALLGGARRFGTSPSRTAPAGRWAGRSA